MEQVVEGMKVVCHELSRCLQEQDTAGLCDCAQDCDFLVMTLTRHVNPQLRIMELMNGW